MLMMLIMAITIADGRKGRSRTRYQVATAWPGMSERWDGLSLFLHGGGSRSWFVCWLSSWYVCWLSSWSWSIFISSRLACFFLSFPCFQRVSMTPELLSDEDSINSYIEWWFKCCFLSSPSRILHVCSSWNSICTSRHRRLVFRYLVARSSTCPWTRWPIMFWILKDYKWYTLSEGH